MKIYTTIDPVSISNIYIITDDDNNNGVIIDPGSFSENIYQLIRNIDTEIKKIIITQNTHVKTGGIPLIKKIFDTEIYACSSSIHGFKTNKILNNSIISQGDLEFKVIETPVLSYDSISILVEDTIFVGDLFQAGTLTNLSEETGKSSNYHIDIIKKNILSLPDNVIIYPGKGPATTVKIEKMFNPFFKETLKEDENKISGGLTWVQ